MSKPQSFYRAVNLRDDIDNPQRLSHYQPTSRSLPVVEAVLGRDPTIAIAAYGSGKSLAAGVGALLVRNDAQSKHAVERVVGKIRLADKQLHGRLAKRLASGPKGRVIVLSGHVPDLAREMADALGAQGNLKTLDKVLAWITSENGRFDHLAIIWDEFGRHLENLVAEGRARDLDLVQRLAEWAARSEKPTASLTLLLHQNLLAYAGALNPTSRNEWRKIEGRFRQLRFVEDSRELYNLVAAGIGERRAAAPDEACLRNLHMIAERSVAAGWFDGATDIAEVSNLIRDAWPLSAGALQALPRLVARIAQNERSLFSFLEDADLSKTIGFEELYKAFSDAMRSDVGAGGTHRRWIETESALSKTQSENEREVLAAACLLQLGADGERRKLPMHTLETAVISRGVTAAQAIKAIRDLIARKLLLHRRVNDDLSVWHGVDIDIAGRLAEERSRRADSFDPVAFLNAKHPAPIVRATRHNAKFGTTRYLSGRYILADAFSQSDAMAVGNPGWGQVLYVLAETEADISKARNAIARTKQHAARTIFVIPSQPLPVVDAALELACLESLRTDDDLLAEDPLVAVEIDELMSVARQNLATVLYRLTTDRPSAAKWLRDGAELAVDSDRPASVEASSLMDKWYPQTPIIANDQLMRQRISKQMNTARVRLLMRLMESGTKPWMGYGATDTSVEASVYRTVLERTGLHRERGGEWGFADSDEVRDPGLLRVWEILEDFFGAESENPKPLSSLVSQLSGPPIGLPAGVLPVLVMAGYRAFAHNVSLRSDGQYVSDILGFDANRMFVEPERHMIEVHGGDKETLSYLSELAYVFTHQRRSHSDEALRFVRDAFEQWRVSLPDGARRSSRLSPQAQSLMRALPDAVDPARFFLKVLPDLLGGPRHDFAKVTAVVEKVRNEVDSIVEGYLNEAVTVLDAAFSMTGANDAIDAIQKWVTCFNVDGLMRRDDLRLTDKAVLRTARDTANGRYTPQSLARATSSVLLQRGIEQWQDSTSGQFAMLVRECRARIEDAAIADGSLDERLAPIIRDRIEGLKAMLLRIESQAKGRQSAGGRGR